MIEFLFWLSLVLIVYTHVGYPLLLRLLVSVTATQEVPRRSSPYARP